MNIFSKWLGCKRDMSLDEAIAAFKAMPSQWFWYRDLPYAWSMPENGLHQSICLSDLCVLVEGHPLAYIEGASCHVGDAAIIRHISVEKALVRRQIGAILARAYARELSMRYGVSRIIFSERHSHFQEAGYPAFFNSLGATALPVNSRIQSPDRPDFEWLESSWHLPQ